MLQSLLHQQPEYAFGMNDTIQKISHGSLSADDNSIYRALNRFEELGIVAGELRPSPNVPNGVIMP